MLALGEIKILGDHTLANLTVFSGVNLGKNSLHHIFWLADSKNAGGRWASLKVSV
jgi:hypothetical protein